MRRGLRRLVAGRRIDRHRLAGAASLALVVVGGILLGPILILIILPVMIDVFTPLEAIAPIGDATPEPGE